MCFLTAPAKAGVSGKDIMMSISEDQSISRKDTSKSGHQVREDLCLIS